MRASSVGRKVRPHRHRCRHGTNPPAPWNQLNIERGIANESERKAVGITRDNVMKQAASLDLELPLLLPGIKLKTGPTDYFPIEQMQMSRFKGDRWHSFGPVLSGENGS